MCKELTTLVEQSEWRFVTQCEHGTVHLRWDHVTLSLPPLDFRALAQLVLDEYDAHQPATGKMRLHINNITLEFADVDFHPLLTLIHQAFRQLETSGAPPRQPSFRLTPFSISNHLN